MHKFEIQNKKSVSRHVRRMKLPICGVKSPSKYLLIAIAPHEILPDLCLRNNENQISAIALFVLLMFVCEKTFRATEGFFVSVCAPVFVGRAPHHLLEQAREVLRVAESQ